MASEAKISTEIENIQSVIDDTRHLLLKAQINLKKCPKARLTKGYVQCRIKTIDEYWVTFKQHHEKFIRITDKEQRSSMPYFKNEEFFTVEDAYTNVIGDYRDLLESLTSGSTPALSERGAMTAPTTLSSDLSTTAGLQLPRVDIPTFSGNYEDWPAFQDAFESLIHANTKLSKVQKFHYLKGNIKGEAASLLKNIKITEANYSSAWDKLKHRYGNRRHIVNTILKRLFGQRKLSSRSANQLKALLDTTSECIDSLRNLDVPTDNWDPLVIFLLVQRMDPVTHAEWEQYVFKADCDQLATWKELTDFLESRYKIIESVSSSSFSNSNPYHKVIKSCNVNVEKSCVLCKQSHSLFNCDKFIKLQLSQRGIFVKENNLCYNCLVPGHPAWKCRSSVSCRSCNRRHHSLLHGQKTSDISNQVSNQPGTSGSADVEELKVNTTMISSHFSARRSTTLLATATVYVKNDVGHTIQLRALIDLGSQASFISERATQALKLKRQSVNAIVTGMESTKVRVKHLVRFHLMSRQDSKFNLVVDAYVMTKRLGNNIPLSSMTVSDWNHIQGLPLADPDFSSSDPLDLLLGVSEYSRIIQEGLVKGTPCAQNTSLGWIIFGEVFTGSSNDLEEELSVLHNEVNVDDLLKTFWELDTDSKRRLTLEEQKCEDLYKSTHSRKEDGRYVVRLPFKTENPTCVDGNTREIALNRFLQLERRLKKNPQLKTEYVKVMEEYINLKHMEEISSEEIDKKSVYLPQHVVIREDKESTKYRVVFDASCKGTNGVSLNDELLVGPALQEDLRNIIMRWRMNAVCFVSDVKMMYRMIQTHEDDRDYQRVLYRADPSKEIKDYRLTTVTFGTASAPYLAVKTLIQLTIDEGDKFPVAAAKIREDCYVDDCMSGFDTVEEAFKLSIDMKELLKSGGFSLKKWSSNSIEFMKSLESEERSANVNLDIDLEGKIKALGVLWDLKSDRFQYKLDLPKLGDTITKRSILSDIQKLFDPLGWISPSTVKAKILIQNLWLEGVGWDDEITSGLRNEWIDIRKDLKNVEGIQINRWLETLQTSKDAIQIHGFSDASLKAYAAAVYCRVVKSDGSITVSLVAARTRVAPLKTVSLPRLELCGAVLLSKLLKQVTSAMRIPELSTFAWTDSSIVLSWLFGDPNRWKVFVANRVTEIQNNIHRNNWFHVSTHENPADLASRGILVQDLKNNNLWWQGPEWLSKENIDFRRPENFTTDLEMKKVEVMNLMENINEIEDRSISIQFTEAKDLTELKKTIAYCRRFLNSVKFNGNMDSIVTPNEMDTALKICIRIVQREEFENEITRLNEKKEVGKTSSLKALNPYLDEDNILRVGGRLRHAKMDESAKHPIILGNKNNLTPLIVAEAHTRTIHGGMQLVMCYLRSIYWIIRCKSLVQKHIHNCMVCARQNATTRTQIMGDLPKMRVTPSRPFLSSGVDFAGPFLVHTTKGRGQKTTKAYIAIFICMATKAIHIELVGDMTSAAFIGAFNRFCSRRGKCAHLWSDQGRNFIGANKELITAWKEAKFEFKEAAEKIASDGTTWHFIPAYSPNYGGLWEAGVKSIKYHMKRIFTTNLTFEEMTTVLCEIEACLNSRPLCPIDNTDPDVVEPLTPGHFLIGEIPIVIPNPSFRDVKVSSLTRWQYTQKLVHHFWNRWQGEYLSRLQQRPKWLKRQPEFVEGDVVLIKTDNLPPGKWQLGRIISKYPGPDGCTRVYGVKSGDSITKRCVTKLCPLPVEHS